MNKIYLGFDTSNYTTSAAAVASDILINERKILEVKEGSRGLRQSDALFLHIKNMPGIYSELSKKADTLNVGAVGVSTRPRSVEGSYMPVFLAGVAQARTVADTLKVPLFEFSHQDGHIMAGIYSSEIEFSDEPFLSVHMSGGTTEILKTVYNGYNFDCEIIGGTKDISAGQVTDRVGVAAGLKFPCGAELDALSRCAKEEIKLPISVDGGFFNFSGLETKAVVILKEKSIEDVAKGVFLAISKTLAQALEFCVRKTGIKRILIAGGVASNSFIRDYLEKNIDAKVFFASPELSCDNAVGIALLASAAAKRR